MIYSETDPEQRVEDLKNTLLETRKGFGISVMKLASMREFPVFRRKSPTEALGFIACAFDLAVHDSIRRLDDDWTMPAIENALGLYDTDNVPRRYTEYRRYQFLDDINHTITLRELKRLEESGAARIAHNYDAIIEAVNQSPEQLATVLAPLTNDTGTRGMQQVLRSQEFLNMFLAK